MITVTDLTKRYARHTAVDHISFEVQKTCSTSVIEDVSYAITGNL